MSIAVAATATGPGMPRPAGPTPAKACQRRRKARPRSAEKLITRSRSRGIVPSRPPDGERLHVVLGPIRIEDARLAECEGVLERVDLRRLLSEGPHRLPAAGREENLLGDLAVVHLG